MFRVQKLLLSEFDEIYEPVLVENPFTLVDAKGIGVRQYHIALTCTRIVFGCDNFYKHGEQCCEPRWHSLGLDPEIECFELVSMMPLQFIRFNFFRKGQRYIMIINVQNLEMQEKPMIFEFGGHVYKQHFWHMWRERVAAIKVMQPRFAHITCSSPFSSTDVQLEEELQRVDVHSKPRSIFGVCYTSSSN
ncbi:uncharacterized protein LOC115634299 [Scaptodrosophila lebanonensis]|uniref:Uncharacterized protein LOC115634299 n=1 Tax=Drosophila lebanonensis TaxID=7225 RepID=A0A6J2UKR3_DROLE|nr:uncharacterized protein LOC115634299 [Scaptodrosophila lebanonensis]